LAGGLPAKKVVLVLYKSTSFSRIHSECTGSPTHLATPVIVSTFIV